MVHYWAGGTLLRKPLGVFFMMSFDINNTLDISVKCRTETLNETVQKVHDLMKDFDPSEYKDILRLNSFAADIERIYREITAIKNFVETYHIINK